MAWLLTTYVDAATLLHWSNPARSTVVPAQLPVQFDVSAAFSLQIGEDIELALPNRTLYHAHLDRIERHSNGDQTWIGHLVEASNSYRVIITSGANATIGRINTPNGEFLLEPQPDHPDVLILVDAEHAGYTPALNWREDGLTHPYDASIKASPPIAADLAGSNTVATIDLMVLYTPELVSRYGNADTLINQLVTVANQAYLDSQVYITLRLVHTGQVNYPAYNDITTALNDVTDATDPAFANVRQWRTQYGADLVSVIRPWDRRVDSSICGLAWIGGYNGQPISGSVNYGYSLVQYGHDVNGSSYYCEDATLTHELGHNMGSAHDRAHSGKTIPAYSYSYGYGTEGDFGTIMSYTRPLIRKFSNPNITCDGQKTTRPCGTATENNMRSLNNTRFDVAAYVPTAVPAPTPTPTPKPVPTSGARLINVSSRAAVQTGDSVLIDGFVIAGGNKTVLVSARGPSLAAAGLADVLADPLITLYDSAGNMVATNDNWITANNDSNIRATGGAPSNMLESAIHLTLPAGAYTAIMQGVNNDLGNGLAAIDGVSSTSDTGTLVNLSSRGPVGTGDNVMIAGFIIADGSRTVLISARGPSLLNAGLRNALLDPMLELYDAQGTLLESNDNITASANYAAILATGRAPTDGREAAILRTLQPGTYTAIVRGANNTQGIGLVAVDQLD